MMGWRWGGDHGRSDGDGCEFNGAAISPSCCYLHVCAEVILLVVIGSEGNEHLSQVLFVGLKLFVSF